MPFREAMMLGIEITGRRRDAAPQVSAAMARKIPLVQEPVTSVSGPVRRPSDFAGGAGERRGVFML